jgi:hypothetical protein
MIAEEQSNPKKYKLVRERDNLTLEGEKIRWIDWNENGTFNSAHDEPKVERSLIIDPHYMSYTWLTTIITEILEQKENYTKFKTTNSVYELFTLEL